MADNLDMLRMNRAVYEAKHRERMEREQHGQIVLMYDGEIVGCFDDLSDAYDTGCQKFGKGMFSLIEVGERRPDFGALNNYVFSA